MAFEAYLTYEEYVELGGKVAESAFTATLRDAQRRLDAYTQDRIKRLEEIPDEVKELLVRYIDKIVTHDKQSGVSSYSNGTESVSYTAQSEFEFGNELYRMAVVYLPVELISGVVDSV